ncbi:hypothetical protein DFH09DRAFT_1398144 [Mycena vulgaris]|nr:hypothetical protein DFH09DRAFT_1398144 [Mycena vulgaris]
MCIASQHVVPERAPLTISSTEDAVKDFLQRTRELGEDFGDSDLMTQATKPDVREKTGRIKEEVGTIVRGAAALHEELRISGAFGDLWADLEHAFKTVLDELEVSFPASDQPSGHAQRQEVLAVVLKKMGAAFISVCVKHAMDEERARGYWEDTARPAIENMVVMLGDLFDEHPTLLGVLCRFLRMLLKAPWAKVLFLVGPFLLIPNYWFLRPILNAFGFGPIGPITGTAAAWAQRLFYGTAVGKGTWFAFLTSVGMTLKAPGWLGLMRAILDDWEKLRGELVRWYGPEPRVPLDVVHRHAQAAQGTPIRTIAQWKRYYRSHCAAAGELHNSHQLSTAEYVCYFWVGISHELRHELKHAVRSGGTLDPTLEAMEAVRAAARSHLTSNRKFLDLDLPDEHRRELDCTGAETDSEDGSGSEGGESDGESEED